LAKSAEKTVQRQFEDKWSHLPDFPKFAKANRFVRCVLMQGYQAFKSLKALLIEGKLIFLSKAFYVSRDKNDFFILAFLVLDLNKYF
jgi:hypothetical protein